MSDSDTIISVENLSKRYRLGVIGATTLRESVERWWHRVHGRDPACEMGIVGERGDMNHPLADSLEVTESTEGENLTPRLRSFGITPGQDAVAGVERKEHKEERQASLSRGG